MTVGGPVKAKRIRFGPGDTLGGTAPLIMLRDIDGYQPRRRRARWGRHVVWFVLAAAVLASGWVAVDMMRRGLLMSLLG